MCFVYQFFFRLIKNNPFLFVLNLPYAPTHPHIHTLATKVLIELGANVNATNTMMGSTPLHTALMSPKTSHAMKERLVDQLLAAGAKTWMEDLQRKPPIQYVPPDHPNLQRLHDKLKPPKRNIADQLLGDMISGVSFCKPAR